MSYRETLLRALEGLDTSPRGSREELPLYRSHPKQEKLPARGGREKGPFYDLEHLFARRLIRNAIETAAEKLFTLPPRQCGKTMNFRRYAPLTSQPDEGSVNPPTT